MAKQTLIWIGPGVLNPSEKGKDKSPLQPGDPVPDGFVTRDRLESLKVKNRIVSESAYAKGQAKAGIKPVEDTGKIAELTKANAELAKANEELTTANEELTKKVKS